jgi:AcrR family transcriptional regulator
MSQGWDSRQQRTRSEILLAVGEIIADDGLDGLTMRKLAERAGVAVATLYNQFTDRDGVLVAFVSNGLDELEFELDEQPATDPIDSTRALFTALHQTIEARRQVWRPCWQPCGRCRIRHGWVRSGSGSWQRSKPIWPRPRPKGCS